MSTFPSRSHARSGARSGVVAGCVLVVAAGDLLLLPLMSLRIASTVLVVLAAAALHQALPRPRRVRAADWGASVRRAPAAWAFAAFVIVVLAWAPLAHLRAPDPVAAKIELTGLLPGVLLAAGAAAATHGSSPGLRGMRLGWAWGLAVALITATVEIVTGTRIHADDTLAWTLDPTIVAGPFRNPNDFAAVLAVLISGTIAYRTGTRSRVLRGALTALVILAVVGVVLTQSRGGLIALALVLAIHSMRALLDRRDVCPQSPPPDRPGRAAQGHARGTDPLSAPPRVVARGWGRRTLVRSVLGAGAVVATVAAFTVPALVRLNPIATMITAAGRPGTARSDTLRLDLTRAGWRYFNDSDRLGTGAGSFEHLLAADPAPGVSHIIWMHNSFMELLLQYGAIVGGMLLFVVVTVVLTIMSAVATGVAHRPPRPACARTPRSPQATGAAQARQAREVTEAREATEAREVAALVRERRLVIAETLSALVAFGALGGLAYTALETHAWWMMLAQSVVGAWWLSRVRPSPALDTVDDGAARVSTS